MAGNLEILSIADLNKTKNHFFVRDYQRGYRWTVSEVRALLDDIRDFAVSKPADDQWYCLQPVVVKRMSSEDVTGAGLGSSFPWYEVIDGQQRLTTILLVTRFINRAWNARRPDSEPVIRYQTRPDSAEFLDKLDLNQGMPNEAERNIDFFHMWHAFHQIEEWIDESLEHEDQFWDQSTFIKYFRHRTKIIWYETDEPDTIETFTRLNVYRIPLTNAELTKALFLRRKPAEEEHQSQVARLRQIEIAGEWDRIEARLQRQDYWSFLVDPEGVELSSRIELLLDLMANKQPESDKLSTFHYFRNRMDSNMEPSELWKEIKAMDQLFWTWFDNPTTYHPVGFLICAGKTLPELLELWRGAETKTGFKIKLEDSIRDVFGKVDLTTLTYLSKSADVRNVLLLHNLLTLQSTTDESLRFPFDRYKDQQWDFEHVHAMADGAPNDDAARRTWLAETITYLNGPELLGLREQVETLQKQEKIHADQFNAVYKEISQEFRERTDDENSIANLVLLDAGTNRSYKAAIFPAKRHRIIERVKSGGFVPPGTRNVFLKFYNLNSTHLHFWSSSDRLSYYKDLETLLKPYLPKSKKLSVEGVSNV